MLSDIQGGVDHIDIVNIHNRLVRNLQNCTQSSSMLPLVERKVLIPELFETAVAEGDVLDGSVFAGVEIRKIQAAALDVVEYHVTETGKEGILRILSDIHINRAAIYFLHLDVGEGEILHQSRLAAEIIRMRIDLLVRKETGDGIGGVMHHDV